MHCLSTRCKYDLIGSICTGFYNNLVMSGSIHFLLDAVTAALIFLIVNFYSTRLIWSIYCCLKNWLLQVPFLFGVPAIEKLASVVIHLIFRRTGRHLFMNDEDEGRPPLLKRMIADYGDCYFMYACIDFIILISWMIQSLMRCPISY